MWALATAPRQLLSPDPQPGIGERCDEIRCGRTETFGSWEIGGGQRNTSLCVDQLEGPPGSMSGSPELTH